MTSLGASIVVPEAVEAMVAILPQFIEVNDLQRKASEVIARLTGGELASSRRPARQALRLLLPEL
jgi:D-glucosaminate-6-phosphate ammonia-lyase